ncbi:MAG TPA: glycosyltransferase family 2 protein [Xanthobacteraceae bacterium]|nr:glycosyltransferase family 2 protein [Xanthobacteraceae bacterium]
MEGPNFGAGRGDFTLSVVLPNYNHARLIPRAVKALLSQTLPPDEVIVVDDNSTDDSRAVIADLAAASPRLRVLENQKNEGTVGALQRGLAAARGTYVYLAAADDFVLPDFFSLALTTLKQHPGADLFCAEAILVDGATERRLGVRPPVRPIHHLGFVDAEQARRLLARSDNWILTGSSVFRREAIARAGGLDDSLGSFADGYLARKIALTNGFCYAPRAVATWWVLADSYSRRSALDATAAWEMLEVATKRLAGDPVFPSWYAPLFGRRWRFSSSRLAVLAEPINRSVLLSMAATSPADRYVVESLLTLPDRLARFAIMGWLWLRWRPTTLFGLARTYVARAVESR